MIKKLLGAVSVFALAATIHAGGASAADMDMPIGAYDWSGPYAGAKVGYAFSNNSSFHNPNTGITLGSADPDGAVVGIMSGYNLQFGSIVGGLDSDFSGAWISGARNIVGCLPPGCQINLDTFSTTRVRLGYAFDRVLPYVTGGIAGAHANLANGGVDFKGDFIYGWTAGVGLEWAIMDNVHWRAEYLFADFDKHSFQFNGTAIRQPVHDLHVIRTGIAIKTQPLIDAFIAAF